MWLVIDWQLMLNIVGNWVAQLLAVHVELSAGRWTGNRIDKTQLMAHQKRVGEESLWIDLLSNPIPKSALRYKTVTWLIRPNCPASRTVISPLDLMELWLKSINDVLWFPVPRQFSSFGSAFHQTATITNVSRNLQFRQWQDHLFSSSYSYFCHCFQCKRNCYLKGEQIPLHR